MRTPTRREVLAQQVQANEAYAHRLRIIVHHVRVEAEREGLPLATTQDAWQILKRQAEREYALYGAYHSEAAKLLASAGRADIDAFTAAMGLPTVAQA